jgi:hypothetical protein
MLSAQIFIPSGQGAGSAGVEVLFYPSSDCSGAVDGEYSTATVAGTNAWTAVPGGTPVPPTAHSAVVRLVVTKQFQAPAFQAYFDNVLFKPQ